MAVSGVRKEEVHGEIALADEVGESMLDEIRRSAEDRLRQIEPLIEEAYRLRDVLEVIERSSVAGSSVAGAAAPLNGITLTSSGRRAAKGSNKRVILELVGRHPGITAAEISERTGMKRTVVASTVSRLKRHGDLQEHTTGGVCLAPVAGASR